MVRCKILVTSRYSDYEGFGTNRKARMYTAGDNAKFPIAYAERLEASGMVETLSPTQESSAEVIEIEQEDRADKIIPEASESAQEFAAQHRIDLSGVMGSGKDGRIILADVRDIVSTDG